MSTVQDEESSTDLNSNITGLLGSSQVQMLGGLLCQFLADGELIWLG